MYKVWYSAQSDEVESASEPGDVGRERGDVGRGNGGTLGANATVY